MTQRTGHRRAWLWAFGLAALVPILTTAFFAGSDLTDGRAEIDASDLLFEAMWWTWAGGSVLAAAAAGAFPGLLRGLVATVAIWALLCVIVAVAYGPTCGLQMSAAPRAAAAIGVVDGDVITCLDPSRWNNVGWVVLGGMFATGLTTIGGVLGIGVRLARRPGRLTGS